MQAPPQPLTHTVPPTPWRRGPTSSASAVAGRKQSKQLHMLIPSQRRGNNRRHGACAAASLHGSLLSLQRPWPPNTCTFRGGPGGRAGWQVPPSALLAQGAHPPIVPQPVGVIATGDHHDAHAAGRPFVEVRLAGWRRRLARARAATVSLRDRLGHVTQLTQVLQVTSPSRAPPELEEVLPPSSETL